MMRIIGLPFLILGIILLIFGFVSFATGSFSQALGNMAIFAAGGIMMVIGFGLVSLSIVKPMSKYYATEASSAIKIASKSFGEGIKESNVLANNRKEIIKIKCPHCGYLESEDADFCSKCGKKI
jgi:predicted nucleic-acid-binding Zn-ribbon protein